MLVLWHDNVRMGEVAINEDDRWTFCYDPNWQSFPLIPQFPLGEVDYTDAVHNKYLEWYLDNLLPEGAMREAYAKQANIRPGNTWSLLLRYGRDVAGAISILDEDELPDVLEYDYSAVTPQALAELIKTSRSGIPMMVQGQHKRMSLAGAQEKLTIYLNGEEIMLPEGAAPSSHILKPESAMEEYPLCPANEYFCMQVAKEMGLSVPNTFLATAYDERVYIVERYDRQVDKGGMVHRLHQIDLCQALGIPKSRKYEDEGGFTIHTLINQTVTLCRAQAKAKAEMVDWVIFNYLIGNSDAHAKNFSLLVNKAGFHPAPYYDLVCVEIYHKDNRLSNSIGGEMEAGYVEGAHWDAFAYLCNLPPKFVRERLKRLAFAVQKAANSVSAQGVFTSEERDFIERIVDEVIMKRVDFIHRSLLDDVIKKPDDFKALNDKGKVIDERVIEEIFTRQ